MKFNSFDRLEIKLEIKLVLSESLIVDLAGPFYILDTVDLFRQILLCMCMSHIRLS